MSDNVSQGGEQETVPAATGGSGGTAGSGGTGGSAGQSDPVRASFDRGVDQMRTTAKWILTLLAAVGAVLTAGVQLSHVGQLKITDPRLWIAGIALAVALTAVGFIISRVVRVLTGGEASLERLAEEESEPPNDQKGPAADIRLAKENDFLNYPFSSVGDLHQRYELVKAEQQNADTEQERAGWNEERRQLVQKVLPQLFMGVRYYRIRRLFGEAVNSMLWFGLVAALGIVVFAWATNPLPSPTNSPPFQIPAEASLFLTDSGRSALSSSLGQECVSSDTGIEVLVLSYSEGRSDVVSVPTQSCTLFRFPVVDGITGTLQPKVAVEVP